MAQRSNLFSGATFSADDMALMLRAVVGSGVMNGTLNGLVPGSGPGLGVTVATGGAIVQGEPFVSDSIVVLAFDSNSGGGATRTDTVVVKLNKSGSTHGLTPNNSVRLDIHKGTPGAGAPTLTQTSTIYEVGIANVAINTSDVITAFSDTRPIAGPGLHDMIASHTGAGLVTGTIRRATGATSFAFGTPVPSDLPVLTQVQFPTQATNNPTTTSATVADIPEMGANVNVASPSSVLLLIGYTMWSHTVGGTQPAFYVGLNGTDGLAGTPHAPDANYQSPMIFLASWTGLNPGVNPQLIRCRWSTPAPTLTATGLNRALIVAELRR